MGLRQRINNTDKETLMAGYSYGAQGGYWGSGVELQPELDKVMTRLLSPEEFSRLDNAVTSAYGGYMGYLNAFAKAKKFKQQGVDSYNAVKAGTYEPFDQNVTYGASTSTAGRRIPATGKGQVAGIPATTIHKDIYGRPTQELAGQGIQRGMGGEVIPQTYEQVGAQADLQRNVKLAIPREQYQTAEEIMKMQDTALQFGRTAMDRYRTSKEGQAQQRIEVAKQAIATRYQLGQDKIANDKTMLRLKNDLNMERDVFKNRLASGSQDEKNQFAALMKSAEFEHDLSMQAQRLEQAAKLAQARFDNAKTIKEADQAFKVQQDVEERKAKIDYYLMQQTINPGVFQNKPALDAAKQGRSQQPQSANSFPDEASARAAGRVAGDIILVNGKKFRLN